MSNIKFEALENNYTNTNQIPKDLDLFYHCLSCDSIIRSVPKDNGGCKCGNIFIDKDMWRLSVNDFTKFEVVRKR